MSSSPQENLHLSSQEELSSSTQRRVSPRVKIQAQVCKTDMRRYCEKTSIIFPFLVEEQNCNSEPKKIYEWEMKTHSKKHHYTEDCKKQNNEIYAQYVKKTLKPTWREDAALLQRGKEPV